MKRTLASALAAFALAAALLFSPAEPDSVTVAAEPYSALRLHVLADSDDADDQAAKLAVRDAVLDVVRSEIEREGVSSAEEALELLKSIGSEVQRAAENTLAARGMDYGAQLVCGEFDFPDRVYGDTLYPEGRYNALRVILGSGEGHNWWCVMFPPLCIIESENAPTEYDADGTLRFKSFFSELFSRIFGGGEA